MRGIIVLLALALPVIAAARQPRAVALTYDYATEYRQHGLSAKLQLGVDSHWRIEPELIYFAEKREVTSLMMDLNLQYVQPIVSQLSLYPFAGVSYSHWGYEGPNKSRWGANLGAGLELGLGRNWMAVGELRYLLVSNETEAVATVGLKYLF